jgi:two-component system cell cycle sensor histidine kinase/response regulator CckA
MTEHASNSAPEGREHPESRGVGTVLDGEIRQRVGHDSDEGEPNAWANRLGLLLEVNAVLAGALDAEAVLGQILARLRERARLTHASIYLLSPPDHQLRMVAESGYSTAESLRTLAVDGAGLVAWAARTAEPVYSPNVAKDPRCFRGDPRVQSEYAVPLLLGREALGVLDIESDALNGIRAVTRKLVDQFAAQTVLALERSELYKQLRASEERFRSIFEQGRLGVALSNLNGEFSAVNPAFARMLDYEPEELRGKQLAEITHPLDRKASLEGVWELLEGKAAQFTLESRYLRKSGEATWGSTIVSLIRDSAGHPAYLLAMIQDINERKKAEEERAQLQQQFFQAQKMGELGALAGGIAHDFNNLLSVMLGFASLLRLRLSPEDPLQEPVRMIEESAEHAADLSYELLGFARPGKLQARPVCVEEVLDRLVKIIGSTFDRRIRVRMERAPALPWVEVDPSYLEQAVLNLCINARDAMPEGGTLTLETSVVTLGPQDALRPAQCPPGSYVRIAVRDTGRGMEPQVLQRVFEPFFSTKEPGKGTGLGLAMVDGFVKNHGGFVKVESQPGAGSQFTLHLPALEVSEARGEARAPSCIQGGSGTVLVVDDEPLVLAFAEEGLKRLGYKVLTAENGQRALETFAPRVEEIDCVLLDMVMPEIDGLETCRKLRAIDAQVPVILSSGYSVGTLLPEAREAGVSDFIGKPYTLEALSQALQKNAHR